MISPELNQPVSLEHLARMTDCFGLIQHANYSIPDFRTGYTTDDNARALVVVVKHHRLYGDQLSRDLAYRYLAFLMYTQTPEGRFHNFVSYDRRPVDTVGSEDAFGRAVWALAHVLANPIESGLEGPAERMLHQALPWVGGLEHPRSKASCLTGLYWWSRSSRGDVLRAKQLARPLADYLVHRCHEHTRPDWEWILPEFTYANAALPKALYRAHQLLGEEQYLTTAERAMDFLVEKTFVDDTLAVVGNREWLQPDGSASPAHYDQQPIEAGLTVEASLAAYDATGEAKHLRRAWRALGWFFGRNLEGLSLYDPETGGCFDALMDGRVNENRGAESVVSLLMAQLVMLEAFARLSSKAAMGDSTEEASPLPDGAELAAHLP
ncbi:MAG: glycosyltransferase [Armatimonadetes bacterium]|nr:glycosyltransferase [Armatimonadota bacterium]